MHRLSRIIAALTVLFGLLAFARPVQAATAADYAGNTLETYGIPDAVIEVVLANSTYADGQTPRERGQQPATFTMADVAQLATFSLAERSVAASGAVVATPSATVSNWVAGLAQGATGYDVSENIYNQVLIAGQSDQALADNALSYDGKTAAVQYHPPFNMLMLVAASATSATTVDLTGVTERIGDSSLAQQLMSLFDTPRLPHLTTLMLGHNNLGMLDYSHVADTLLNATAAQRITTLDLNTNRILQLAWDREFAAVKYVTNLNLAGNAVLLISSTLNSMLQTVITNAGNSDLSDSNLDVGNWNTIIYILNLVNMDTGSLSLSDQSVNAIVSATANPYSGIPQMNDHAVSVFLPQMTADSIQSLLDNNANLSAATRQALQDRLVQLQQPAATLAVSGTWNFGTLTLGQLPSAVTSTGLVSLAATLPANSSLTVAISPWQNAAGASFAGALTLPAVSGLWGTTVLGRTPQTLLTNTGTAAITVSRSVGNVSLQLPDQTAVTATSYSATVNWSIVSGVSATAN
ncbi:hypothetical protein [Lacticaseibacillus suihuaensis]